MPGSDASFNINKMLKILDTKIENVKSQLNKLETSTGGTVDLGTMFQMQFQMQLLSQYLETVSNTLTAINTEMINMAKGVKGQ